MPTSRETSKWAPLVSKNIYNNSNFFLDFLICIGYNTNTGWVGSSDGRVPTYTGGRGFESRPTQQFFEGKKMANTRKDNPEGQEKVFVSIPESIKRTMKGSRRYKLENAKAPRFFLRKPKSRVLQALSSVVPKRERGSLWSRFMSLWRK